MIDNFRPTTEPLEGLCREYLPDTWFTEAREDVAEAKRICGACDVRNDCLEQALERRETWGVWGGLTTEERANILNPNRRSRIICKSCNTLAKHAAHGLCAPCYQRDYRLATEDVA